MGNLDVIWAGWRSEFVAGAAEAGKGGAKQGSCVFCRILASGLADEESHVVWRHPSGHVVALLNAYPYHERPFDGDAHPPRRRTGGSRTGRVKRHYGKGLSPASAP